MLTQPGNGILLNHPGDGDAITGAYDGIFNPLADQVVARHHNDVLVGGFVFTSYTGRSIEIGVTGFRPNWANKDLLWVAFHYPFIQLGCEKLFTRVKPSNAQAMRLNLHLGFQIETTIKDVYPDGDLHVLSMYRKDCRWLRVKPRFLQCHGGS